MKLYAESSAVLAWLLAEPTAESVREALAGSELIVASELTLVECDRVLIRAAVTGELPEADAAQRQSRLTAAAAHWHLLRVDDETTLRARRPFPAEPIRTLDALHLASALVAHAAVPDLALLSLDRRIRSNSEELGFPLVPAKD